VSRLSGRRALVTGASSGIGAAFARRLHALGCPLVLVARREDRLHALAGELGGDVQVVSGDLSATEGPQRVYDEVAARGLRVDVLVNNAGLGHTGPFHEEPLPALDSMLDVNARAAMMLTRLFLPAMVARGEGFVVNVISTSAFQPVPFLSVYGASKAFLLSLTEALATELQGSGVTIQALCPGLTATEFQQVAGTDRVLFNRTGSMTPDAVAAVSLKALERGRLRVIPGWSNRLTAALVPFTPGWVVRRMGATLFRPRPQGH
jgi:short-subunit dehydrogenase